MKRRRLLELGATAVLLVVAALSAAGLWRLQAYRQAQSRSMVQAVLKERPDEVRYLLSRGVSPSIRDGQVPVFFYAVMSGNTEVTELLLEAGADVNVRHPGGDTPLVEAVRAGQEEMVRFLLQRGASPALHGRDGETPLMVAAGSGQQRLVNLFLARRVPVDATDIEGRTALGHAAHGGRAAVVTRLLDAGADPSVKDHLGRSAAELARKRGHTRIVALLERS